MANDGSSGWINAAGAFASGSKSGPVGVGIGPGIQNAPISVVFGSGSANASSTPAASGWVQLAIGAALLWWLMKKAR